MNSCSPDVSLIAASFIEIPSDQAIEHRATKEGSCGRVNDREKIGPMIYLVTVIHVLICFFIIIVVLLQSGQSGDISAAFGGQGSQTAFGPRGAASALEKATTWSAVAFMVTSIVLSVYVSHGGGPKSVLQGLKSQPVKTQPAAPAKVPAPPAQQK
jgi:preprotein translocase subunit SecG